MSWLDGDHNPADLEPDTEPSSLLMEETESLAEGSFRRQMIARDLAYVEAPSDRERIEHRSAA